MKQGLIWLTGILGMFMFLTSCGNSSNKSDKEYEHALNTDNSIQLLTEEIKQDSSNYDLWKKRASLYLEEGNVDFAFRDINRALELNKKDPALFLLLADVYFTIGKVENSLASIRKAISLAPDNQEGYMKMARVKLILRKYQSADSFADKVLTINPDNAEAYYIKGVSALEQRDSAGCIRLMKVAAALDTGFFAANLNLAVVLDAKNDASAVKYYKKAIEIKPDNMLALYSLAMLYQKEKQFKKALTAYDTLISRHPDNAEARFNKGYIFLTDYLEFEKAEQEFKKAIEIKPDYTEAVYNLGRVYEAMGDTAKAKEKYREALKLTTNYPMSIDALNRLE
jgi:tetratricopeptide (TPR) repeat protein